MLGFNFMKLLNRILFLTLVGFAVANAQPVVIQKDIFYEISKNNIRAIQFWLKTKPDLSITNNQGQTVLGAAVIANKRNMVKFLIKAGANVNALDRSKKTALDYAVESDNVKISATLAKYYAKVTTAENMYRFKDLMRGYATKLFIRALIIGVVFWGIVLIVSCIGPCASIVLVSAGYGHGAALKLIEAVGLCAWAMQLYDCVLYCKAISWNRLANRFDGLLADSIVEPVVIFEK